MSRRGVTLLRFPAAAPRRIDPIRRQHMKGKIAFMVLALAAIDAGLGC